MTSYKECSREELLGIIEKLEAENRRLRASVGKDVAVEAGTPAEARPERFREKYAARILDRLPDMLTVLSPDGKLVDLVSSEQTNHVGEPGSAIIGRNICSILSPEAYARVKENLDQVNATGEGATSHHDITLDGVTRHYENRIFKLDEQYALCMCRDVTEQQQAKHALEQANRRMKMAEQIEALNHWYYFEQSGEVEAPGLVERLSGVKDATAVRCRGELLLDAIHPADRQKVLRLLVRGEFTDNYVEFRIRLDGRERFLHSRVIHMGGEPGSRVIEGYTQDMTHIVERVHELEALKYAINNVEEEIYACTLDGRMEFANAQFRNRNRVEGDVTGLKVYELGAHRSSPEEWNRRVASIRSNDGTLKFTVRFKDEAGQVVAMEVVSYLIYDRSKQSEIIWFFSRDITRRMRNENRVKELNTLMETILNNIPVYLFVKDPGNEFRYLYWNKAFEEHSGIPAGNVLGRTDLEVFPDPQDAEKFRRDDLELLRTNGRLDFVEEYKAATGETRYVVTSKALVPAENRLPLIIGIAWDITEQKKTERELIEARIKAEESDRLKSAFLANMSHEIRTPLNAIVGFSKLIADAADADEKQLFADIIDSNSELLLQLINDILDLSKIEAGTLEFNSRTMDMRVLCQEQLAIHKTRVKEGVRLVLDDRAGSVVCLGDHNRLAQVYTNLIGNAIKFTAQGEIRFGYGVEGDRITGYVSDTGIGIAQDKMASVFERFIKLNDFAAGTGLGLSITKMIVERMGGTIGVSSEQGRGTTFRFSIPYRRPEGEEVHPAEAAQRQVQQTAEAAEGKRILVAEDIDSNFMLIDALIGRRFDLIRARNGQEAVDLFAREHPDLVLMDLKMPVMDGYEATRRIRGQAPAAPLVVMSAFAFEGDIERAYAAGCSDYITKPVSKKRLMEVIGRYLG